jgi:hypothetical protein
VTPTGIPTLLEEAAERAGVSGAIEPYGESFVLKGHVADRGCDIGLGRQLFWIVADTSWELPERSFVLWAPAGSYQRIRSVREDGPWAESGDAAFDSVYLVGGDDASLCAQRLREPGRRALCAAAWVHPGISWLQFAPPGRRRHVGGTPPARLGHGHGRTISARYVAECVAATLAVATDLEK